MAFTRIYIHLVFATKNRYPFLDTVNRKVVLTHIRAHAKDKGIYIHSLNGFEDHIHLLIRLEPSQDIASIAKIIKGESAHWVNEKKLFTKIFSWATGYYAASVEGEDMVRINSYIQSQEARHFAPGIKYLTKVAIEKHQKKAEKKNKSK